MRKICSLNYLLFQIYDSYACRKNKGTQAALLRALYFSRRFKYFLKLDMKKYFDSISHIKLNLLLTKKFKDTKLLKLFKKIIASYSLNQNRGLPIGNLTSQYFANFYLSFFDRYAKEEFALHITPVFAHIAISRCRYYCNKYLLS